jgi:hypothetical protein
VSAHDAVTKSLRVFISPVPWPKRTQPRRRTLIFGGGCLFWLLIGWVVFFGYLLWWSLIAMYVMVLFVARFYYVLGCLCWWGVDSSIGVGRRAFHHRDVNHLPPPPDRFAA